MHELSAATESSGYHLVVLYCVFCDVYGDLLVLYGLLFTRMLLIIFLFCELGLTSHKVDLQLLQLRVRDKTDVTGEDDCLVPHYLR
jgi:hypothetical protein